MTPTSIPAELVDQGAELIAFASTEPQGLVANMVGRARWTELSVFFLHDPDNGGKPWVAQTAGMTRIEGEYPRYTRLASGTLERALKLIDEAGDIGIVVAETAREWAEDNRVTIENAKGKPISFSDDYLALEWLYGEPDEGHTGYSKMLARDTGANESTVRMQISGGRKVMVPLRAILPFIDRKAFRRARKAAARG